MVFHFAGVNRPQDISKHEAGNASLTAGTLHVASLAGVRAEGRLQFVFSSSIQADLNNPYGASKAKAEAELRAFAVDTGAAVSAN